MITNFRSSIQFGDDETARRYLQRCHDQVAAATSRWTVAPLQSLNTGRRIISAGGVVELRDLGSSNPDQAMRALVERGVVLEKPGFDDGPEAA